MYNILLIKVLHLEFWNVLLSAVYWNYIVIHSATKCLLKKYYKMWEKIMKPTYCVKRIPIYSCFLYFFKLSKKIIQFCMVMESLWNIFLEFMILREL